MEQIPIFYDSISRLQKLFFTHCELLYRKEKAMKTVKIIIVIIAIVSTASILMPLAYGDADSGKNQDTPAADNILVRFHRSVAAKQLASTDDISPLVQQAQLFSGYLNHTSSTEQSNDSNDSNKGRGDETPPPPPPPPPPPVGQIKLVATFVNEAYPELNLALIDLPGEGIRWVRQGNKVNYITIKEIMSGLITALDGRRQPLNLIIEPKPFQPSLVKG